MDPDLSFHVSSGGVVFGAPHNMRHGASVPLVPASVAAGGRPSAAGTVIATGFDMNMQARNGKWQAFGLRDGDRVVAWFCCHEAVDPEADCARILDVSGSPYEDDSGSHRNCEETRKAGVVVINRYDWTSSDKRGTLGEDEEHAQQANRWQMRRMMQPSARP